jgi:hypothetical protein
MHETSRRHAPTAARFPAVRRVARSRTCARARAQAETEADRTQWIRWFQAPSLAAAAGWLAGWLPVGPPPYPPLPRTHARAWHARAALRRCAVIHGRTCRCAIAACTQNAAAGRSRARGNAKCAQRRRSAFVRAPRTNRLGTKLSGTAPRRPARSGTATAAGDDGGAAAWRRRAQARARLGARARQRRPLARSTAPAAGAADSVAALARDGAPDAHARRGVLGVVPPNAQPSQKDRAVRPRRALV